MEQPFGTFVMDLCAHEMTRLAAVVGVLAELPGWDPAGLLAGEAAAHRMLYTGLDDEQRATLRVLVEAGVLDD